MKKWEQAVRRWQRRLGLGAWDVTVRWDDESSPEQKGDAFHCAAKTDITAAYMMATVTGNSKALTASPEQIEETACHEMVHVLLGPLTIWITNVLDTLPKGSSKLAEHDWEEMKERTTTEITKVLMKAKYER